MELVQKVAKLSATVLILGESGTGKEMLARLIHRDSAKPSAPFVAVNLAAIPKELVESTLFGHEKGSFTGAIRQQLGKFELASGGTLFLDEVGDLRYELQAKLLRAIQEGEIERVGGTHPIKTDLRIIAATNVDLEKAVKEGRFREDLFYRLNVIPIRMPSLRDRIEDLPELARFFLRRYNVKFRKDIQGIAESTIEILRALLVAGEYPRAGESDRAPGGGHGQGLDYGRRLALRVPCGQARQRRTLDRKPARQGGLDLRAQLHRARTREVVMECHGDGARPRHSLEHVEVQDGPSRNSRAGAPHPRQLTQIFTRRIGHRILADVADGAVRTPADGLNQPVFPPRRHPKWPITWPVADPAIWRRVPLCQARVAARRGQSLSRSLCAAAARRSCRIHDSIRKSRNLGHRSGAGLPGIAVALYQCEANAATKRRCVPATGRQRTQRTRRTGLARPGVRPMQPSMFNVQVPLADRNEVFLMNTFSDAQLLVSPDVVGSARAHRAAARPASITRKRRPSPTLAENGFVVESRERERQLAARLLHDVREDTERLKITVLTTLQCNFACDYCFQGDHGDYNKFAAKMSLETAKNVADWIEERLDEVQPEKFTLTLFGGEPLLNLPVAYYLAERCHALCAERGIEQTIIDHHQRAAADAGGGRPAEAVRAGRREGHARRRPDTHNRMRPLRGKQGTFDRIIENVRRVADKVPITIGGNFDETSWDSYPALLDFLREQEFADKIAKINFKPIIKAPEPEQPKGIIPLTVVGSDDKPLGGTCMTSAGAGGGQRRGHAVRLVPLRRREDVVPARRDAQGRLLHAGRRPHGAVRDSPAPRLHHRTGRLALRVPRVHRRRQAESTGHIDGRDEIWRQAAAERFDRLSPSKDECGDCSYIPVCGGGCSWPHTPSSVTCTNRPVTRDRSSPL